MQRYNTLAGSRHLTSRDESGCNILHLVCNDQRQAPLIKETLELIQVLPVEMLDEQPHDGQLAGMTPLHIVSGGRDVSNRRHEVIEALWLRGVSMETRDRHNRTPLLVCAGAGYLRVIRKSSWMPVPGYVP